VGHYRSAAISGIPFYISLVIVEPIDLNRARPTLCAFFDRNVASPSFQLTCTYNLKKP
jgi:hypothetical protein